MARHRNIEEEFRAISPPGYRGIPSAQPIAVGVTGSSGADSTASMSQASQEISQLESQFKQQADLIQANTQALQDSTSVHTGTSIGSSIGGAASSILGGGLGLFSPIVSGIMSLFGVGSKSAPAPLPFYTPPPSVQMSDTLRSATPSAASASSAAPSAGSGSGGGAAGAAPQVTVNVSAMDSQSFMDRSGDIASAVREAMLNLHPINDVVANL
jgi:hypothetical protein